MNSGVVLDACIRLESLSHILVVLLWDLRYAFPATQNRVENGGEQWSARRAHDKGVIGVKLLRNYSFVDTDQGIMRALEHSTTFSGHSGGQ